jgi:hypothetical protein
VEFNIIAELKGRPSWSAIQDITGRILRGSEEDKEIAKDVEPNSLLVQGTCNLLECANMTVFESNNLCASALQLITQFFVPIAPPPPVNLITSDVKMTSVTVDWPAPMYHEPYRITHYTVQYKKANTEMSFYDAVVMSSKLRKAIVKNLDSGTKYLMRVVSVNAYGSESSKLMKVETKQGEQINNGFSCYVLLFTDICVIQLSKLLGIHEEQLKQCMSVLWVHLFFHPNLIHENMFFLLR